jgi:hypothetical protein
MPRSRGCLRSCCSPMRAVPLAADQTAS